MAPVRIIFINKEGITRMGEAVNKENMAKIEELEARREKFMQGGGPERIERQMHAKGKLSIRERIDLLFDKGTFVEQYLFAHAEYH